MEETSVNPSSLFFCCSEEKTVFPNPQCHRKAEADCTIKRGDDYFVFTLDNTKYISCEDCFTEESPVMVNGESVLPNM